MRAIDPADIDETCPPAECVVRTDLVGDAEAPPSYCETCPLAECEWEYGAPSCAGLKGRFARCAVEVKKYKTRHVRRAEMGMPNANQ